ncbi:MAG: N-acetyl-gamma-glutamyl-phosphate reductase [Rhodospirillales bacterium]|nr:N-acetyl-gamma-glutamyl-phosphate reductase [Rhodospirillales bacterium]
MSAQVKAAILGASGYTGADLVRLLTLHPGVEISALTANAHAGKPLGAVYPHLGYLGLPDLVTVAEVDWSALDVVFCALPHATTQQIVKTLPKHLKIIDLSADFRLEDPAIYAAWYGHEHYAPDLQPEAVYGLPELYREQIADGRLIACPGCYPTAVLLALVPLVRAGLVTTEDLIIDAKSGLSGAGRGLKENLLFCEAGEGLSPYAVGKHRHAPEIEQEIGKAAGRRVLVNFTPHLVPMSRGELVTCHLRLAGGATAADLREAHVKAYGNEIFVRLLPEGALPSTQMVRGSNYAAIGTIQDRIPGRAITIAGIDNLVKGSSGQAVQNMNLLFGFDESTALLQPPLFP